MSRSDNRESVVVVGECFNKRPVIFLDNPVDEIVEIPRSRRFDECNCIRVFLSLMFANLRGGAR